MTEYYQYYVEGETEKKFLQEMKNKQNLIIPGKIEVLNVVNEDLSLAKIMTLRKNTNVILVFDTDTPDLGKLKENIDRLNRSRHIKKCMLIPQVSNLEEELLRCCDIRSIKDLLDSKSNKDFKGDFIRSRNLMTRLEKKGFDIDKLWVEEPKGIFEGLENEAQKIKIKKK